MQIKREIARGTEIEIEGEASILQQKSINDFLC